MKTDGTVLVWGAGSSASAQWLASISPAGDPTKLQDVTKKPTTGTIESLGYTPLRVEPTDVKYTGPGSISKAFNG